MPSSKDLPSWFWVIARTILGLSVVIMYAGVLVTLVWVVVIEKDFTFRDVLMAMVGGIIAGYDKLQNFHYGSSSGSELKTKLLDEQRRGEPRDNDIDQRAG